MRAINWLRRKLGFPCWSLSACLKHRVKAAMNYTWQVCTRQFIDNLNPVRREGDSPAAPEAGSGRVTG